MNLREAASLSKNFTTAIFRNLSGIFAGVDVLELFHTKLLSRRVLAVKGQGRFSPSPVRERVGVRAYPRAYPCSVLNATWYQPDICS
ncbi:hypothetical protein SBDP1_1530028 [Syntrophobacter sp. SbD1]|nr:hypothetical protein SBDP1_1530028 [Syntrophobacter sp. SbD1]